MSDELKEEYRKALIAMYELGVQHGRELAEKDLELASVKAAIGELMGIPAPSPAGKGQDHE